VSGSVVVTQEKFRDSSPQRFVKLLGSNATYYGWLEVSPTANPEQIRKAYRLKSKLYHPDTTTLPAEIAVQKFRELNEAYAVLSNPEQRSHYDRWISTAAEGFNPSTLKVPSSGTERAKSGYIPNLGPKERPLSPGELFALFILGLTFLICLVLALILGFARGEMVLQTALPAAIEKSAAIEQSSLQKSAQTKARLGLPQKDSAIMEKGKAVLPRFTPQSKVERQPLRAIC
jgi:curved DNA-binding protein CbpA